MELNYIKLTSFFALLIFIITLPLNAQVGINTVTPSPGAMLDIESSDKGLLIPRVALTGTNDTGTITPSATKGLLVFNTATAGAGLSAVTEGFYYWDSSKWVPFQVGNNTAWEISGNDNITNGTHFLGTLNNRDLDFRTNGTDRFRIPGNADQVLAMANGSAAAPFYSWNDDRTMGFWKSGLRQMDMVINGTTYFNANANTSGSSDLEWTFNPGGVDLNLRVETDNNANALFVNGELDNIGLGTNAPVPSAQLEMADISKGLLVNRVVLTATNVAAPVTSPATGLLVFNTNTAGTAPNNVSPGFYFWDSSRWVAMDGTGGRDWSLLGNTGTNASVNYIGTGDATDFVTRTNNAERMRVMANGKIVVNNNQPLNVTDRFSVLGAANENTIYAEASGGDPLLGTGIAIFGSAENNSGVRGVSDNYHGVYGRTAYENTSGLVGATLGIATGNSLATGVIGAAIYSPTTNSNIGIRAMSGSGTSISPGAPMSIGINSNAIDLGLYVLTEGTSGDREAAQFRTNYSGDPVNSDNRDPSAYLAGFKDNAYINGDGYEDTYYGGYFYSGGITNGAYAYVGARRDGTNYKIVGSGTVSTIVSGEDGTKKTMFASEAPEVLFEDFGTGKLINGSATINIDPIFSKNIYVSPEKPLKVFIQLEGDCKGVYVANKSANSFTVKELQNGTSDVSFSWHIVGNRADELVNGERTVYQSLRFPTAPDKITPTPTTAQTFNEKGR